MKSMTQSEYEGLIQDARLLEKGRRGPRVWLKPDGRIVKVFYTRRLFSSNRLWPYATRFKRAGEKLAARGFRSIRVDYVRRCPFFNGHVAVYPLIPGKPIREIDETDPRLRTILAGFAGYLAEIQASGMHFRALHLGNMLFDDESGYGVIDMHSMRFQPWPLSLNLRLVNFLNMLRYDEDCRIFEQYGLALFLEQYLHAADLGPKKTLRLLQRMATQPQSSQLATAASQLIN